jgi:hypothetical protein
VNDQFPTFISKSRFKGGMLTEKNSMMKEKMMLLLMSKSIHREGKK